MTIKINKTESKLIVTNVTRTCDGCGKVDNYDHFSAEDDGKPWECPSCWQKSITKKTIEENQELIGATVVSFDAWCGDITRIRVETKNGKERILDITTNYCDDEQGD